MSEDERTFRISHEETEDTIAIRVGYGTETVVFIWKPASQEASVKYGVGEQEEKRPPESEPKEITLEGNPAKAAKYDREKHTFLLRFAHHPNPQDRTLAHFYDVVAEGEKADELFKLFLTDTRLQLRITGWDISQKSKLYKGTQGIIQADSIEKLPPGTRARPDIVPGRVRLSEKREG